jgi:hypothetical protein
LEYEPALGAEGIAAARERDPDPGSAVGLAALIAGAPVAFDVGRNEAGEVVLRLGAELERRERV